MPVASVGLGAQSLETIQPGAARGIGTLGWYGFWFLDAQEKEGFLNAGREKLQKAGVKRIVYYDVGEVGDYAAFFTADGRMTHTGWSLPWWKGREPLTARWFGLDAFMRDVPWAPFPTAKAYGLPPFTTPDGKSADDLYAVLARRGLDGKWSYATPEMNADAPSTPLKETAAVLDRENGTLKLRTPPFETYLIVYVTPRGSNDRSAR